MKLLLFAVVPLFAALVNAAPECQWGPAYWCQSTETAQKCGQLQYCQQNLWETVTQGKEGNSVECDVCEFVVTYLDKFVDSNTTEEEAKAAVEKLCSLLGTFSSECKILVEEFFPDIWKLLLNDTDPDTICTLLRLCSSSHLKEKDGKEGDSVECDICKFVVMFLDKFVDSNSTEEEAEKAVRELCNFLGGFAKECNALIDEFFPLIWQMIVNEIDNPERICDDIIKVCNDSSSLSLKKGKEGDSVLCDVCEFVVMYLDKFVDSNTTEEEAKAAVKELCSLLGAFSTECDDLVDKYFDMIWKLLVDETDPDTVCTLLGLCSSSHLRKKEVVKMLIPMKEPKAVSCLACTTVVGYIVTLVENNRTENEIIEDLDKFCSDMKFLSGECQELVDNYFPDIWNLLKKEMDPKAICTALGLCSSSRLRVKDSVACDTCKDICEFLQQYVDDNTTENTVRELLEDVCDYFPAEYKEECYSYLTDYFDAVWELMQDEVNDDEICYQAGFCSSMPRMMIEKPSPKKEQQNLCDLCKLVANFLKSYLDSNETEEEVKQSLDQLCQLLPSGYKAKCSALVKDYFTTIWNLLKAEVDNDEICIQLDLCSSSVVPMKAIPKDDGPVCELCKLVIGFIKPYFDSKANYDETKEALEDFCKILRGNLSAECTVFVEDYFDTIWELINETNADTVCSLIKLCTSNTVETSTKALEAVPVPKQQDETEPETVLCELCELVMKEILGLIDTKSTQAEIEAALEKVCGLLPSSLKNECLAFVETYGKDILDLLLKNVSPDMVCTMLGVCLSEKSQLPMDTCSMCTDVMKIVDTVIETNFTSTGVKKALDAACSKMSFSEKLACEAFMKKYEDQIVEMLIKIVTDALDPDKVCQALKLCSSSKTSSLATPWKMVDVKRLYGN